MVAVVVAHCKEKTASAASAVVHLEQRCFTALSCCAERSKAGSTIPVITCIIEVTIFIVSEDFVL